MDFELLRGRGDRGGLVMIPRISWTSIEGTRGCGVRSAVVDDRLLVALHPQDANLLADNLPLHIALSTNVEMCIKSLEFIQGQRETIWWAGVDA